MSTISSVFNALFVPILNITVPVFNISYGIIVAGTVSLILIFRLIRSII